MEQVIELSHKEFLKIDKDYSKAAEVAELLYVSDKDNGIIRNKKVPALLISIITNLLKIRKSLKG